MARRICLIKSVITAIPLYYLSLFKAPESVCKSIINIQRRFLWGWGKEKRPLAWVSWKNICKPKEEGGLGIRDICKFNAALLAKWRWRCISEEKGRWMECMDSKYDLEYNGTQILLKLQSWWWRDLRKVCGEEGTDGWFQEEVGWRVGSGDKARFWEDVWVDNANLKSLFPRLYSLSLNQGQKVEEVGVWEDLGWRWNLRWRRVRFEWEIPLENTLGLLISRAYVKRDRKDARVWKSDESGSFTVRSAYECLVKADRGPQIAAFKYLWKTKTFPNVVITAWRVMLGRVPTRECLRKRGVMLDSVVCVMCQSEEESCQHLFLDCKHARSV